MKKHQELTISNFSVVHAFVKDRVCLVLFTVYLSPVCYLAEQEHICASFLNCIGKALCLISVHGL